MGIEFGGNNKDNRRIGYPFEIDKAITEIESAIGNLIASEEKFRMSGKIKHENITMQLRVKLEKIRDDLLRLPSLAYVL